MARLGLVWILAAGIAAWLRIPYVESVREVLLPVLAAWLAGAALVSVPYARRWGASFLDAVWISGIVWILISLPALCLVEAPESHFFAFLFAPGYAAYLHWVLQNQGRYAFAKRDLPELEGDPRAVAEAVLKKAGLTPVAIRVISLASFNGWVFGIRKCIVVLDRRVTHELPSADLAALVAHEAGHLRARDVFRHLAIIPTALLCALATEAVSGLHFLPIFVTLAIGAGMAVRQAAELRADRFAARLTSAGDTASMLKRIHADMPEALGGVRRINLLSPILSHPPLDVRLSALGIPSSRRASVYALVLAASLLFSCTPLLAAVLLPDPHPALIWTPGAVLFAVIVGASILISSRLRKSFSILLGGPTRGHFARLHLWISLGLTLLFAALQWILTEGSPLCALGLILSSIHTLAGFAIAASRRARGLGVESLPGGLKAAVVEAIGAVTEGRPEEGLERLTRVHEKYYPHPWLRAVQGECFFFAGRLADARTALEVASLETGFLRPKFWLAMTHQLLGNLPEAARLASEVCAAAANDPVVWRILSLIQLDSGDVGGARASIARAIALKPQDAYALGTAVLVAMEEPGADIDARLADAERLGPKTPSVLLARARRCAQLGRREEATAALKESVRQLEVTTLRVWGPYYRKLAGKWGIDGAAQAIR